MALFRKASPITDLIGRANRVFQEFSPDDDYLTAVLAPLLAELYAALKVYRFKTVADLEAVAEPLDTMPPVKAAMCAASVLHSGGKLLRQAPLGEQLAEFVAASGMAQAQKAVPLVDDKITARQMITSMNVLWSYEPSPFKELDHAQAVYLSGHLALVTGEGRDVLKKRWQEALQLLADVDPEAARTAESRDLTASAKKDLSQSWSDQLAGLRF